MNKTLITLAGLLLPLTLQAQFSQPVRDVENPAQNLFVATGSDSGPNNQQNVIMAIENLPQGKRLAIEALTIRCLVPNEASIFDAKVVTYTRPSPGASPKQSWFMVNMVRQGEPLNSISIWVGSLVGKVYTDYISTTTRAFVEVARAPGNTGNFSCTFALNGGLTNLPL
jgi:hypothetical protein